MRANREIEEAEFVEFAESVAPRDLGDFTADEQQAAIYALLHAFKVRLMQDLCRGEEKQFFIDKLVELVGIVEHADDLRNGRAGR